MPALRKIAFVVHHSKSGAISLMEKLVDLAQKNGVLTKATTEYPLPEDFLAGQEACAVIGGDGTILSTVAEAVRHQVPVFGINRGHLGFLASFTPSIVIERFDSLLKGHFKIVHRPVIEATFANGHSVLALNDLVIKHSHLTRLLSLKVSMGNEWVTDYAADGLIFATPTGSTAYNLSAGGPIVHPDVKILTMTPICPHTLSNRSLIFPPDQTIQVHSEEKQPCSVVSIDGQVYQGPNHLFPISIGLSKNTFPLLQPNDYSYFQTLRTKLKWG